MRKFIKNYKKVQGRVNTFNHSIAKKGYIVYGILSPVWEDNLPEQSSEIKTLFAQDDNEITKVLKTFVEYSINIFTDERLITSFDNKIITKLQNISLEVLSQNEINNFIYKELKVDKALDSELVEEMLDIWEMNNFQDFNISNIQNREAKRLLFKKSLLNGETIDANADEVLAAILSLITNESLFIKNAKTFDLIRENLTRNLSVVNTALENHSNLFVTNFNRQNSIFMSIKVAGDTKTKALINKIAKGSKKGHVPFIEPKQKLIKINLLRGKSVDLSIFKIEDLVLAYNAIKNLENEFLFTRVRNGKLFYRENESKFSKEAITSALNKLKAEIIKRDITIPVSDVIEVAVPTSKKHYLGGIPLGTSILLEAGYSVGIAWHNNDGAKDLDMSLLSSDGTKIGWDSNFTSEESEFEFSGDITNASDGANENFTVKSLDFKPKTLSCNIFKGEIGAKCNFIINKNKEVIFESEKFPLNTKESLLGYFANGRFSFQNVGSGYQTVSTGENASILILNEFKLTFNDIKSWLDEDDIEYDTKKIENLNELSIDLVESFLK